MPVDRDDIDAWDADRLAGKRDRTARLLRVLQILRASGEAGIRAEEVGRRTGMSKRSAYRDIKAIEGELGMPLWSEGGRWGVEAEAFLPPLRLTLAEAMAVVLAARLMTRYADKYDPDLAGAFGKLEEVLPEGLRAHVERTLGELAERHIDPAFNRHVADLTRAWADRRVVQFKYLPANYTGGDRDVREATVHPYLLEPSLATHALYLIGFDETRGAIRTFKVERILDLALVGRTFDAPEAGPLVRRLRSAWDIIADQPETEVVLRFAPAVASRVLEATWHPTQQSKALPDGSLEWRARVSGTVEIRLWVLSWGDDVEVVSTPELRENVAATLDRARARYGA